MGFFSETLTAMLHKTDDLCAWRYFTVFAKTGSLSVASRVLQVEPSSLSRAIAGLEKSLGCELIVHGTRPLQLTDAAVNFLAKAGYDPEFGARPVKRAIQHYMLNDLSKKLLAQAVDRNKPIIVDADAKGDGLVFRN